MATRIRNANSQLYVGIREGSKDAGTQLVQWNEIDDGSQIFEVFSQKTVEHPGTDALSIQNVNSGLFVGVREASSNNGAQLLQWTSAGDGSQDWIIIEDPKSLLVRIQNIHTQKVWAIPNGSTNPGEVLIQWDFQDGVEQLWRFENV